MSLHTPQTEISISFLSIPLLLYKPINATQPNSSFIHSFPHTHSTIITKQENLPKLIIFIYQKKKKKRKMAANSSVRSLKHGSVQRCSKQMREHKARLYIIWRCTVLLLCWHD
ncbi:hypothetical protein ABFS83_04G025300 [Erythranthe nasuta]